MRGYHLLAALARRYRVSLLVTRSAPPDAEAQAVVRSLCCSVRVLDSRWAAATVARKALQKLHSGAYHAWYQQPTDWRVVSNAERVALRTDYANVHFDLVHVHRLHQLSVLESLPEHVASVPSQLDLDDVESVTRDRLAALALRNGDRRRAATMRRDADAYRRIERGALGRFSRVFVCSTADQLRLSEFVKQVDVIPNVVDVGMPERQCATTGDGPFVFLFVGSLDYYPNRDAMAFFCREIAPVIRQRTSRPFVVRIVADGTAGGWRAVPIIPEIHRGPLRGSLADEYRRADAVIVPIRAGGGTRIKVIEAFAYRKAVISTSVGIEGLAVQAGEHALVGDLPDDFASHCLRAMADSALRMRLADRASTLAAAEYGPAALRRRLDDVKGLAPESQ